MNASTRDANILVPNTIMTAQGASLCEPAQRVTLYRRASMTPGNA